MMDEKALKMPFSTFDFFGYLIPGIILLLGLYIHDRVLLSGTGLFLRLWGAMVSQPKEILNVYIFPLFMFVGIIVSYIMGHVVSAFSSSLMDRMIIDRVNLYPYALLLKDLFTLEPKELFKRRCGKIVLLVLMVAGTLVVLRGPSTLLFCVAGILVILLWVFKEVINNRFKHTEMTPLISMDATAKGRLRWLNRLCWKMRVMRTIPFLLNEVTVVCEKICRSTFGLVLSSLRIGHPFPKPFQELFKKKFEKVYGIDPNGLQTNVFWLAGTYIVHHLPSNAALAQRAYNYFTLMRNLSMTCFLLLWYGVIMHFSSAGVTAAAAVGAKMCGRYYSWILVTAVFTSVFGLRYYNTYYNHYTKIVLRAFVTPTKAI